jgi:hypothetical protein
MTSIIASIMSASERCTQGVSGNIIEDIVGLEVLDSHVSPHGDVDPIESDDLADGVQAFADKLPRSYASFVLLVISSRVTVLHLLVETGETIPKRKIVEPMHCNHPLYILKLTCVSVFRDDAVFLIKYDIPELGVDHLSRDVEGVASLQCLEETERGEEVHVPDVDSERVGRMRVPQDFAEHFAACERYEGEIAAEVATLIDDGERAAVLLMEATRKTQVMLVLILQERFVRVWGKVIGCSGLVEL